MHGIYVSVPRRSPTNYALRRLRGKGSHPLLNHQSPSTPLQFDALALFRAELNEHRETFESAAQVLGEPFLKTLALLKEGLQRGGKLMLFGNGGSAADAQHIAAELLIRYKADRASIAAISLTTDTSTLTACGNDLGFDALFERQIAGLGREFDVAIGISTSGKSVNVIRGLRQAKQMGLKTVGLTGQAGQDLIRICDAAIVVPSSVTARIQEMHILIGHIWCGALEQSLALF
jgi:D-sedoheptulose 7-phosphate isomerase